MFFSFDGLDGVGKTTQRKLFCDWLRELGHTVVECRDPGSTPLGENIRSILLDHHKDMSIDRRGEMLLFMAARAQLIDEVIRPALASGHTIVSDRYLLANVVYQGHAGGLDPQAIWQVGQVATGGLMPDITFVLDLAPQAANRRIERPLDGMETQDDDFHRRLRQGYLDEANRQPDKIVVIDAARSIESVHEEIRRTARRVLG